VRILILQQLAIEPPALIGEVIQEHGIHIDTIMTWRDTVPETLEDYDGIVAMGGPMSARDAHLPAIAGQIALLRRAIATRLPVLGICLGAQLLARAADAQIMTATERELGWYRLTPTPDAQCDPLFSQLPEEGLTVFQWHGETFSLPKQATLLATCPKVPHQAFRLARGQYGLQFHVEVDESTIGQWVDAGESERHHLGPAGVAAMLDATPCYTSAMREFCRQICTSWIEVVHPRRSNQPPNGT